MKTYELKVFYMNCRGSDEIEIERGKQAEEDTLRRVMVDNKGIECKNCGC